MYITATCPVRISLVGGSSDLESYLEKHHKGSVISFTPNLNTYVSVYKDVLGRNSSGKYIINYSKREEVDSVGEIQNHLVKVFFEEYQVSPCSIHMTSDIFSSGSGLAVSSSYACCLAKSLNPKASEVECGEIAHRIEKKVNPLLGLQDTYGCCIGGFKKIEFNKGIKYKPLPTKLFDLFNVCLYFTGQTRSSTEVLKTIKIPDVDVFNPLVNLAETALLSENYSLFMDIIKQGWVEKKKTSTEIIGNKELMATDDWISSISIAHKLCGAGNGGFFLAFFKKDKDIPNEFYKIELSTEGVKIVTKLAGAIKGIVAGAFDLIHPGYCRLFKECKNHCDHLTVALHDDPSIERKSKPKPIHSVEERKEILSSIKYIDEIVVYQYESDLANILTTGNFHKRFLGNDYMGKCYTGTNVPIVFVERNHDYSTSKLKKMIYDSYKL
jgi:D-glycero-alpha-D-manno-heptose-7-phosphate kinase